MLFNAWAVPALAAAALCLPGGMSAVAPQAATGRTFPDYSDHWAGYVAYQGPYRQVSATWAQPRLGPSRCRHGALTLWVGLGGYSTGSLAQAGTSEGTPGLRDGQAWWEISPAAMVPLPLYVAPGQTVAAHVAYAGADRFYFSVQDTSTGASWSHMESAPATPDLGTAEVIAERPCLARCGSPTATYAPLGNFGQVTFAAARADNKPLGATDSYGEQMYTQAVPTGDHLASPGGFSPSGSAFSVRQSGCS